jgi:hypothetical protein
MFTQDEVISQINIIKEKSTFYFSPLIQGTYHLQRSYQNIRKWKQFFRLLKLIYLKNRYKFEK